MKIMQKITATIAALVLALGVGVAGGTAANASAGNSLTNQTGGYVTFQMDNGQSLGVGNGIRLTNVAYVRVPANTCYYIYQWGWTATRKICGSRTAASHWVGPGYWQLSRA